MCIDIYVCRTYSFTSNTSYLRDWADYTRTNALTRTYIYIAVHTCV